MVYGIVFTMGYLCYDLIVQVWYCGEAQDMLGVIIFHHISIFVGLVGSMVVGYGFITVAFFVLTIEVSSIFLNYRSIYSKEELNRPHGILLQLTFVILFTLSRMLMLPYYVYLEFEMAYWLWA